MRAGREYIKNPGTLESGGFLQLKRDVPVKVKNR